MTDRQTDIFQQRSQWWSVTCYDNNITIIEDAKLFPKCVKAVHGGREQCPSTGRVHFQGAVECNGQQRAVFFRDWLPGVHFEKAISKDALKKYALKEDTACGVKQSTVNPVKYMTMDDILIEMAKCYNESKETTIKDEIDKRAVRDPLVGIPVVKDLDEVVYWLLVKLVLKKHGKHLASSLANPAIRKMWINTQDFWIEEAALSITGQLDNEIVTN